MTSSTIEKVRDQAKGLVQFVNDSPSPYHTVSSAKTRLINAGFHQLQEKEKWDIQKGKKYFLTRNESALIAFIVGEKFEAGNGFSLVGAHTDSPCLKVKPISKKEKYGYLSVGVQCYGGALWNTWLDRDLTVAGRVMIKNKDGKLEHHLVHIKKPILRVPNLCIHLSTGDALNKETHLLPILATKAFEEELNKPSEEFVNFEIPRAEENKKTEESDELEDSEETVNASEDTTKEPSTHDEAAKHHSILVKLICKEVGCEPKDLVNMELALSDTQPATIGGAYDEFVFAPRLDNQFGSYCAVTGIIESAKEGVSEEKNIRMINIFDNEECGSGSAQGAQSMLTELVMRRIADHFGQHTFEQSIGNSFLLSADQGHAIHPNYPEKHEDNHRPALHKGPLLKINCNQRYSTTAITAAVIRDIAKQSKVPLQDYVVRNDSHCGTTIGPIQAARLGMRTVDVGGPELSMHSIRETCDITSVQQMIDLFKGFFRLFPDVDAGMKAN